MLSVTADSKNFMGFVTEFRLDKINGANADWKHELIHAIGISVIRDCLLIKILVIDISICSARILEFMYSESRN